MKTIQIKALCAFVLFLPVFAHAGVFTDAIAEGGAYLLLKLVDLMVMVLMMVLTAMMISVPIVADFALVIAAMLLPFCIAAWPITKTWATTAFSTIVSAALTSTAAAFFLSILLQPGGALDTAVTQAAAQLSGAAGTDRFGIALGASLGLLAFSVICIVVAMSIAGVVGRVFGGASIDGARIVATGALAGMAIAKGMGSKGVGMGEGAAKGATAAIANGGGVMGAAKGAAAGAGAAMRSQQRQAMLNRINDATKSK